MVFNFLSFGEVADIYNFVRGYKKKENETLSGLIRVHSYRQNIRNVHFNFQRRNSSDSSGSRTIQIEDHS